MNKARRNILKEILDKLHVISDDLESVKGEEEDSQDTIKRPDCLEQSEEVVSALEEALSSLGDIISSIDSVIE
jgi:hypothetical protein